jgi:hypothetical protein
MVLHNVALSEKKFLTCNEFGLDSKAHCLDQNHFNNYPHQVIYSYNSRGFRDQEWPNNLDHAIWCIGDSFTVGIGCPQHHTWSRILQDRTNTRTINVSLDGASNVWIKRQALQILNEVSPHFMVIHWSYFHRFEDPATEKSDSDRRMFVNQELLDPTKQLKLFISCVSDIELAKQNTIVIHSLIPNAVDSFIGEPLSIVKCWHTLAGDNWPECPKTLVEFLQLPAHIVRELKHEILYERFLNYFKCVDSLELAEFNRILSTDNFVPMFDIIDYARDSHHYDQATASNFVDEIVLRLGLNRNHVAD